jgi:hypothetical protein
MLKAAGNARFSRIAGVRRVSKPAVAALAAFLLAVALVACGGNDSSTSGATGSQAESTASTEASATSPRSGAKHEGEGKPGGGGAADGESEGTGPSASEFVPKHHQDSGGGSAQFMVKGGDNSVQEFGEEADTGERDDAAAVLHDYLDARAQANWAAACRYMSKNEIESLESLAAQATQIKDKSCAGVLEKLTNPAAKGLMKTEAEKADVGSLRVEGEQAFVIYTGLNGTVMAVPMTNEGGVWKVASLTGAPLS